MKIVTVFLETEVVINIQINLQATNSLWFRCEIMLALCLNN